MLNRRRIHLTPCHISKSRRFELIDVIDFGRGYTTVILVDSTMDIGGTVMSFETSDDALVHWLNVCCKVWGEVLNTDVLKTLWNNMT